jgi:aryl-alcohol dehydrogenase-like predicted oxidoreductase
LGGYHIGKQADENESIRIIRSAIDRGITFMDNCWDYNDGISEIRMGKALRDGYRQRVFLMTKIDGRTKDAAAGTFTGTGLLLSAHLVEHQQVKIGAGGGTRTRSGDFFKIHYSAITTLPPEANSLITNELE